MLKTTYKYKADRPLIFAVGTGIDMLGCQSPKNALMHIGVHNISGYRQHPLGNEHSGTMPLFAAAPAAAEFVLVQRIGAAPLEWNNL
jgi:hypothetical protein